MDNNNSRYSFYQLFTEGRNGIPGNYRLVIPIIQRDYAQGRDNEKARTVRKDFLSQLYDMMSSPVGSHDLDFVYGVSAPATDRSKRKEFVPLDGQQRLTSLFLIHYYLATRTTKCDTGKRFFKSMRISSGRLTESLFTYRTRSSAAEFCNNLLDADNDFSFVFRTDEDGKRVDQNSLSFHIRNASWFYLDWEQDPTVCAMLTMLDAIDEKFNDADHAALLERLMSVDDPSVTFIFMDLNEYNLTDDLYIKMNSRGKPLTSFENFKAKFEQYIASLESNSETKVVKKDFAFNIDTKWANLFWELSKEEIKKAEAERLKDSHRSMDVLLSETLDLKISRFIKMVLANQYATDIKKPMPDELTRETPLSFNRLFEIGAITERAVAALTDMFDLLSKGKDNIFRPVLPPWVNNRYFNEVNTFESIANGNNFNYTRRFRLYCYFTFRLELGDDPRPLTEWMRFVFNISLDDNLNVTLDANTYFRAISFINVLIDKLKQSNTKSIIDFMASDNRPKVEFFPEYQYREEILKACLLAKDISQPLHCSEEIKFNSHLSASDSWSHIILKQESHPYFTGQIGFILKMAGIDEYFSKNGNLDWSEAEDAEYKQAVCTYGTIASEVFKGGYSERELAQKAPFERAMLAKHPEYLSNNFLNSTNQRVGSKNLLRDTSWKSMLRIVSPNATIQKAAIDLMKCLDSSNVVSSLEGIIKAEITGPQWRKDIVRYPYLMGKSPNGFFYKTDDGHRILAGRINFSQDDHEVYSFVLYREFLHKLLKERFSNKIVYDYGKSNAFRETPFVWMSKGAVTLKVKSEVDPNNGELLRYYLTINSKGDKNLEKFLESKDFVRESEGSTNFKCYAKPFSDFNDIDEYRSEVAKSICDFFEDLIT